MNTGSLSANVTNESSVVCFFGVAMLSVLGFISLNFSACFAKFGNDPSVVCLGVDMFGWIALVFFWIAFFFFGDGDRATTFVGVFSFVETK